MRLIGQLDNKVHADRFASFLMTKQISAHVEFENEHFEVWIRDEDQIDQASKCLSEFQADPEAPEYQQAVGEAQSLARAEERKKQQAQKNVVQMQNRWNAPLTKRAPLTVVMVGICALVFIATNFGKDHGGVAFRALAPGSLSYEKAADLVEPEAGGTNVSYDTRLRLASVMSGEIWRTITPIFIHFDVLHILFNMMWLVFFGRQIEGRYGTLWFALLVVILAIPSNLAGLVVPENLDGIAIVKQQGYWTILAGGMSGVAYGLFGYVWMKMVFDRNSGLYITSMSAAILLGWLIICMAPATAEYFGHGFGNWAHGIGLITGLAVGYFPKLLHDLGVRRSPEK